MAIYLYRKIRAHRQNASAGSQNSAHEMMTAEPQVSPTRLTEGRPSHNRDSTNLQEKIHGQGRSENHDEVPEETITAEEKKAANRYRWKLVIGLFLPFSVQALDVTIIASAIPFIASDFSMLTASSPELFFRQTLTNQ